MKKQFVLRVIAVFLILVSVAVLFFGRNVDNSDYDDVRIHHERVPTRQRGQQSVCEGAERGNFWDRTEKIV